MPFIVIREMRPDDLERSVALLEILRQHTPYRCLVPDWSQVINMLVMSYSWNTCLALVAEHDNKLTGILLASAVPIWWADQKVGPRIASDLLFYSQRAGDGRVMLRKMVEWAFNTPRVVRIEMAVSSGQADIKVMRRLYEREGFALEGTLFVRNHPKYQEALDAIQSK